jgi:hypothetical protein
VDQRDLVIAIGRSVGLTLTRVGSMFERVEGGPPVLLVDSDGRSVPAMRGYDHFGQAA